MFFCIYKPRGISSHTAVHRLKKQLHFSKVGHAGTLDQEAEGLLIIAVEGATPLLRELLGQDKTYEYTIDLSMHSPSHDLSTQTTIDNHTVFPSQEKIQEIITRHFLGDIEQVPPTYSAIWVDGKRSYELVMKGKPVELKKRPVTIYSHEMISYDPPFVRGRISVSSGTYIRSIARDLGRLLGTGGVITHLIRTSIGALTLSSTHTLETVTRADIIPLHEIIHIDREHILRSEEITHTKNGDFRYYQGKKPGRELLIDEYHNPISLIEIDANLQISILAQLYPRLGKRGMIGEI